MKLNKSLADELNQPKSFPGKFFTNHSSTVRSNKNHEKHKTQKPVGPYRVELFQKNLGFYVLSLWEQEGYP